MASNWAIFTIVAAFVAVAVLGLIIFPLVRWRRRPGDALPPQFANNYPLELAWTILPLLVVGGLFVATYRAEARVDAVSDRPAAIVAVDAYRWGWTFAYRGGPTVGGASSGPASLGVAQPMPELVLPAGETTRIELSSSDVDHGFWIPDFLFKRDAIPGQTTAFDLSPTKLGTFEGRCSAFCGLQHANMLFRVRVVTPAAFAAWEKGRT
jgi:cytochrome c oxidase subunit 2